MKRNHEGIELGLIISSVPCSQGANRLPRTRSEVKAAANKRLLCPRSQIKAGSTSRSEVKAAANKRLLRARSQIKAAKQTEPYVETPIETSESTELPEYFCDICMETKTESDMFQNKIGCRHLFCFDCIVVTRPGVDEVEVPYAVDVVLGASVSVMPLSTYLNLGLGELVHTRLTVELVDRIVKYPKGIAKNMLVGVDHFLSTVSAKIDVYKRKITLRVREEKIIFKSIKHASSLIKRVMEETLVLNRSLNPFLEDYIKLYDPNEPTELKRNQGDDLIPTIEDGEIHIDCAHNLKFACMIGFEFTHANFFPLLYVNMMTKKFHNSIMKDKMVYNGNNVVRTLINVPIFVGNFSVVTDFAVLENKDAYHDDGMGEVIFGKPFLREVGIKTTRFDGLITLSKGDDEVTFQMVRSHSRFGNLTNKQCNKIPLLLREVDRYGNANLDSCVDACLSCLVGLRLLVKVRRCVCLVLSPSWNIGIDERLGMGGRSTLYSQYKLVLLVLMFYCHRKLNAVKLVHMRVATVRVLSVVGLKPREMITSQIQGKLWLYDEVCLYMHDPREPHFSALKQILRYVQGTLDYGLQLFSSTTDSLIAYSDTNWAVARLRNGLLRAEYRGVANAVAKTCWIWNLLRELHTPLSSATIMYCDNVSFV
nr:ribonuclease H-like domain-containing protein [Tanacetum cinerariifolium]